MNEKWQEDHCIFLLAFTLSHTLSKSKDVPVLIKEASASITTKTMMITDGSVP